MSQNILTRRLGVTRQDKKLSLTKRSRTQLVTRRTTNPILLNKNIVRKRRRIQLSENLGACKFNQQTSRKLTYIAEARQTLNQHRILQNWPRKKTENRLIQTVRSQSNRNNGL